MKYTLERQTLWVSFSAGLILMLWGILFSVYTTSNVIDLDAGAYIIGTIVDSITLIISYIQSRKHNRIHPLGYGGYIPLINLIRSVLLVLICVQSFFSSLYNLFYPNHVDNHETLFLYISVVVIINQIVYFIIRRNARISGSALLYTDALEWRMDILYNLVIAVIFGISFFIRSNGYHHLLIYLDPGACLLLSLYLVRTPLKLIVKNTRILTVTSTEKEIESRIMQEIKESIPALESLNIDFTILDIANNLWIDIWVKDTYVSTLKLQEIEKVCHRTASKINEHYRVTFRFK